MIAGQVRSEMEDAIRDQIIKNIKDVNVFLKQGVEAASEAGVKIRQQAEQAVKSTFHKAAQ